MGTLPPANQTSAITNEITIVVGSGPESRPVPDVTAQTVESAQQVLNANGFTNSVPVDVDSPEPAGQVVGTNPAAGQTGRARHRDAASGVARQPVHACPTCAASSGPTPSHVCGRWAGPGVLDKGADARDSGQRTNAVVTQSPSPGSTVELRRHDHAELRCVAARTVLATSSSSVRTSDSAGAAPQ